MINYLSKTFTSVCLVALTAATLLFGSCTKVDDSLGGNLVPGNQQMKLGTVTFDNSVTTSTYFNDSIGSSNVGVYLIGQQTSPTFGVAKAGFLTQYLPYYNSNIDAEESEPFGLDPVVDSVTLNLPIYKAYSDDTLTEQNIDIFLVNKKLRMDTTYYTNFDYKSYTEAQPFASFNFTGTHTNGMSVKLPNSIGEMLVDASDGVYEEDSLFTKKFPGFVFMPTDASAKDAAVYAALGDAVSMTVYYRNMDENGAVADTLYSTYSFDDSAMSYGISVNIMEHDYSATAIDTTEGGNTNEELTYIQGFGGVATSLTFEDDIITELKSKVGEGTEYSDIAISKAVLYVSSASKNHDELEDLPTRLGMFTNYVTRTAIVDYNYSYEEDYGATIPYGGYFEGSLFEYSMDVTTYLAQLLAGKKDSPKTVTLGTEYSTQLMFQEAILAGSGSDTPPRLEVTYTLIK